MLHQGTVLSNSTTHGFGVVREKLNNERNVHLPLSPQSCPNELKDTTNPL